MDTSNSPKQGELTMGKPNSQEITMDLEYFLFRGEMLGKKEIPNAIWLEVIDRFLDLLDPHFKYIDGLKTIEQIVVDGEWRHGPSTKMINSGMAFSAPGQSNKRTRGFFIHTMDNTSWGDGKIPVRYVNLILTEKRQWLRWNLIRTRLKCSSHFILLSKPELCELLEQTKMSGYSLLDALYLILGRAGRQKAERAATLLDLEKKAENILARAH